MPHSSWLSSCLSIPRLEYPAPAGGSLSLYYGAFPVQHGVTLLPSDASTSFSLCVTGEGNLLEARIPDRNMRFGPLACTSYACPALDKANLQPEQAQPQARLAAPIQMGDRRVFR